MVVWLGSGRRKRKRGVWLFGNLVIWLSGYLVI